MTFYERYCELCKEKGKYPQSPEILEAAGVSSPSVTNWKRNNAIPKAEVLMKLAYYFDVSVDYLLGQKDDRNSDEPDLTEAIVTAVWGDGFEATPEEWDELIQYAALIKARRRSQMKNAPSEGSEK